MKKFLIGLCFTFVAIIVIGVFSGLVLLSHRNHALALEEQIKAQEVANKSNYDNMWKKFVEMTQVTDLQAQQIKDAYQGLISGRYEDPNLLFKSVKEDNPKLDSSVYVELQREISAGRSEFDNNQQKIADMVREYNTYIGQNFIMASITGRTPLDANSLIVTSDRTQNAFDSGKDNAIQLQGK